MKEIKLAKWRYFLMMFVLLTSGSVAVDCVYKLGLPFRDVLDLILKDALLPAFIAAGILLGGWLREQ